MKSLFCALRLLTGLALFVLSMDLYAGGLAVIEELQNLGYYQENLNPVEIEKHLCSAPPGTFIFRNATTEKDTFFFVKKCSAQDPGCPAGVPLKVIRFKIQNDKLLVPKRAGGEPKKLTLSEFLESQKANQSYGEYLLKQNLIEEGLYVDNKELYQHKITREKDWEQLFKDTIICEPLEGVFFLGTFPDDYGVEGFIGLPDGRIQEVKMGYDGKSAVVEKPIGQPMAFDEFKSCYLKGKKKEQYFGVKFRSITKGNSPCTDTKPENSEVQVLELKDIASKTPNNKTDVVKLLNSVFTYRDISNEFFPNKDGVAYQMMLEDSHDYEQVVDSMVGGYLHLYITGQITAENEPKPHIPMIDRILKALPEELKKSGKDEIEEKAYSSYIDYAVRGIFAHRNRGLAWGAFDDTSLRRKAVELAHKDINPEDPIFKELLDAVTDGLKKDFVGGKTKDPNQIKDDVIRVLEKVNYQRQVQSLGILMQLDHLDSTRKEAQEIYNSKAEKLKELEKLDHIQPEGSQNRSLFLPNQN